MRPFRFQGFAVDVLKSTAGTLGVRTLAEMGGLRYPYGIAVLTTAGETRWQIIGRLPTGTKHDDPDTVVQGTPPPPGEPPRPADPPEAWMAAALAHAACPEIERLERWPGHGGERPGHSGVTLHFHSTAKIFLRRL